MPKPVRRPLLRHLTRQLAAEPLDQVVDAVRPPRREPGLPIKVDEHARGVEVIGVSIDSQFTHLAWKNTPVENGGIGNVQYALVEDLTKSIASSYGILLPGGVALRGLFLIDTKGVIRHSVINDLPLGRSVGEALRMLDALQFVETHGGEVCPANWQEGAESMKASKAGVADYLAKHGK